MPTTETTRSPQRAPLRALHRLLVGASNDPAAITNVKQGMNMKGYSKCVIQVVPSGGANPALEVLFWSEELGKFISEAPANTKTAAGVDTPQEYSVDCFGRIIFVRVTAGHSAGAHTTRVFVSGTVDQGGA
jgi:hypothetical protein